MPFTGSHPAAVIPLVRLGLPTSALVIGSLSPDAPYFAHVWGCAETTHTWLGTVTTDVVIGLVLFTWWHAAVGPAVAAHLPAPARQRLGPRQPLSWLWPIHSPRRVLPVALGLALGAATHVAWDSFTHPGMWGVTHLAFLTHDHGPFPGFRWAQYASGALGAVVVLLWAGRWWRGTSARASAPATPGDVQRLPLPANVAIWGGAAIAVAVGIGLVGRDAAAGDFGLRGAVFQSGTLGVGMLGVTLLVWATIWRVGLTSGSDQPEDPC